MTELDPDSEQIREVYAQYGLAMYQAQCVERCIAMLLSLMQAHPRTTTRAVYSELIDRLFASTIGTLVHQIAVSAGTAPDLHTRLKDALAKRNWLAHNYFWDRAGHFPTERGRQKMIAELQSIASEFEALDTELEPLYQELGRRAGVRESDTQKYLEEILASAANEA